MIFQGKGGEARSMVELWLALASLAFVVKIIWTVMAERGDPLR